MVVEDHRDTLEMLQHVLHAAGAKVIGATSGQAALAILRHVVPSIVVVDLEMPDLDGFAFLDGARLLLGAREVPMIAISGLPLDLQPQDWKDAGFVRAVVKPVDPFVLYQIIVEVMEEAPTTRAAGAVAMSKVRLGDLVTRPVRRGWVGEVVDLSRIRGGYVTVRWRTAGGTPVEPKAEPLASLMRVRSISGGQATSLSRSAILSLRPSARASRQTRRRRRQDSGKRHLQARDLMNLAARVVGERTLRSVAPPP
jgi:CheY-like chemotaxis protein